MSERLRAQQTAFAAYLRDPQHQPAPQGIATPRLLIYRELYFNNLNSLLAGNFPVLRRILGDGDWQTLVQTFCRVHRAHTPLFTELGQEFLAFLGSTAASHLPEWLPELAHYEWVELALQIADDPLPPHRVGGDVLLGVPVLSPYITTLTYRWPVHRIGPDFLPPQAPAEPTLLLARRDPCGQVRFAEISALLAQLFSLLAQANGRSGEALLSALIEQVAPAQRASLLPQARQLLLQLQAQGCVLGTVD